MFCGFGPLGSIGIGGMFFKGFRMLIFIILIILAIKFFKNYANNSNDPMKILNEKFASGEMDQEEYLKRKSILSQKIKGFLNFY